MITILYQAGTELVYSVLFALANICQVEEKAVVALMELGLDKAIVQLKQVTSNELIKPILLLMVTVCDVLPDKYKYLLKGIEQSLKV